MHKFSFNIRIFLKAVATVASAVFVLLALSAPIIAASAKNGETKTVVIDAGHGGADGGVTGKRTGVKESELNLKVAKLLGEYLIAGGYRVIYTRQNDTMHTNPKVQDNKKRADMFKRAKLSTPQMRTQL